MSDLTRLDVGYLTEAVQELTRAVVDARDTSALLNAAGEGEGLVRTSNRLITMGHRVDGLQSRLSALEEWKRDHEAERHDRINLIGDPTPTEDGGEGGRG